MNTSRRGFFGLALGTVAAGMLAPVLNITGLNSQPPLKPFTAGQTLTAGDLNALVERINELERR